MSWTPRRESQSGSRDRPTLPPIRDIFRDELSNSSRAPHHSPSLTLARLRVSDEDDVPSRMHNASPGPGYHLAGPSVRPPVYGHSAVPTYSRSYYDPSMMPSNRQQMPHSVANVNPHPTVDAHVSRGGSHLSGHPRSMSYDSSLYTPHVQPPSQPYRPQHRNTVPNSDRYDSRVPRYPVDDYAQASRYSSTALVATSLDPRHRSSHAAPAIRPISTTVDRSRRTDDEDQTPIARQRSSGPEFGSTPYVQPPLPEEDHASNSGAPKYECSYCGKGFTRPSSLKIHLNSHTGEKPFVCPVEGCGRSFSVLSNMRRHARVHTQTPMLLQHDLSSDDGSERSPPGTATSYASSQSSMSRADPTMQGALSSARWQQHRRNSSASTSSYSSNSSRRSHSVSSDSEDDDSHGRPGKRSRNHPK